jgi:hypothetical protein
MSAMQDEILNMGDYDIVMNGLWTGSDVKKYLIEGKE